MLYKLKKNWEISEQHVTSHSHYINRRSLAKYIAAGSLLAAAPTFGYGASGPLKEATGNFYPPIKNTLYNELALRPVTDKEYVETYNNFYEFGSHKHIDKAAQNMNVYPWAVTIEGECAKPMTIDIKDIMAKTSIEQRIYRHRCVEAWAMTVPWDGFPLHKLLSLVEPTADAKYVMFETATQKDTMPGLKQFWYPWPYREGLSIEEAMHDLTFMATGAYGDVMENQNGAPLRLAVPWKYGFKHIKSINKITLVKEQPLSFWEEIQGKEYGFWANVNPNVHHPRWSQASERLLGNDERVPTLLYNGYEREVASLYKDMDSKILFY